MTDPSPPVGDLRRQRQKTVFRLMAALLLLATVTLYWPATGNGFVNFDDPDYVTANAHVQGGLTSESVKWAFFNPMASNWHPITALSHMLDCQVYGLKPWGHHLTSVLLHAINAMLLFALLRQMTGAIWRSALVAGLFAVHPLHVESVAWVAERKDVLSAFFGLLTLMAYARYARSVERPLPRGKSEVRRPKSEGSPKVESGKEPARPNAQDPMLHHRGMMYYILALAFLALGLMSKTMLVTWPFVMLLLDYWPLGRSAECRMQNAEPGKPARKSAEPAFVPNFGAASWGRLVVEKWPFFVLAAVASIVTFAVQEKGGAVTPAESLPIGARIGNALISYCRYLGKFFWPSDLAVFYPHPGQWPPPQVLLAGILVLGVSWLLFLQRRRYPYLLMGWLWFLGTLVPVLGLVQIGGQSMADRYTYLPLVGVLIAVAWGWHDLTRRVRYPAAFSVAGSAAIFVCMALTRQQLGCWKDSETLFRHALAATQNNLVAHMHLGDALAEKGRTDAAMGQYHQAIRLKPDYAVAYNNLGVALDQKGQNDDAIRAYQEAIRLKPDYPDANTNLRNALLRKGQTDEAIRQYQNGIRLQTDSAEAHNRLGFALFSKGLVDDAIGQYEEAIRLEPENGDAHFNLGMALSNKGRLVDAIRQFRESLRLKPDSSDAHYHLGTALVKQGQADEAIRELREALLLEPDNAGAHFNLGVTLLKTALTDEAIRQFQEAIRLRPDSCIAHNHLGTALATKGQIEAAINEYQEAIRLEPDYAEARENLARASKLKNPAPER